MPIEDDVKCELCDGHGARFRCGGMGVHEPMLTDAKIAEEVSRAVKAAIAVIELAQETRNDTGSASLRRAKTNLLHVEAELKGWVSHRKLYKHVADA